MLTAPPAGDALLGPRSSASPIADNEIAAMLTWTTDQVCHCAYTGLSLSRPVKGGQSHSPVFESHTLAGLDSVGLSVFEKNFRQHEITGDILPLLTIVELKDMDAKLVGPRTILLRKLAKLKRAYVNYQRNRPLWDGEEERYTNPFEMIADFVGSCCCPDPADKYVLTSSHLKLTHKVYPMGKALRCCSKGTKIHTIDLSLVVDVDASSQQTCCGGRDMVVVEHEKKEEGATLFLPLGDSPNVLRMLRDAVEENQADQKLSPLVGAN